MEKPGAARVKEASAADAAAECRSPDGLLRALFDDSPMGIAWLDAEGSIVRSNAALGRIFRHDRQALIGRGFADTFATEDRDDARAQLAKLVMGAVRHVTVENLRLADDASEERMVTLFAAAIEQNGEFSGLLVHVLDVTERSGLDMRFAHAQKLQALGQLAGSIAHDFNNLIAAMLGSCDMLLGQSRPGNPGYDDVWQIRSSALRARELVRQLLAFARKQPLRPVALRVDQAITALVPMLRRLLGGDIVVAEEHAAGLPLVRMDPGQFDQVIVNLAVNARDAMPGGGGLLLRTGALTLKEPTQRAAEVMPPGTYAVVEVADSGTGISKEIIDDIFQPFFTTKPAGEGTGLGLATVYGIVRQSGGYIVVDSALGAGATFRIFLQASTEPVGEDTQIVKEAPASAEQPARRAERMMAASGPEPSPAEPVAPTVLLVDDEDVVRRFAARALRGRGCQVTEAADGETAMEAITTGESIDLLLTDLALPGMHGRMLIEHARQRYPDLKVIVISADVSGEMATDRECDPAEGGDDGRPPLVFLPKPFTLAELVAEVGRAING